MNKRKILAALTIGQTPRVDITGDVIPLLLEDVELREYGALDNYTLEEITERFAPEEGDEVLVSRMRDGRQARFAEKYVTPLIQEKIYQAEQEGADAIILFCTGVFPHFEHHVIFLEPQQLFHSVVEKLADGRKIGLLVPMPDQIEQAYQYWGESGVAVSVTSASPYLEFEKIRQAAAFFKGQDLAFICTDCMGYSAEMKKMLEEETGLPVILPRTLVVRILNELFA